MKSKKWALNLRDWTHGFLMAAGGSVIASLVPMVQTGSIPTTPQIKAAAITGIGVGIIYLWKNYISNSKGEITKPE